MPQKKSTLEQRARSVLTERFGHADFNRGQWPPMQAALEGRDAVVVMPTGSGKSLVYQLPALMLPTLLGNVIGGVTLVAALNHGQVTSGE